MMMDLCGLVKPAVTLVDGVVAMEGDGPSGGSLKESFLTIGSRSPYHLDLLLCHLLGLEPQAIPTVREGIARRLCPNLAEELEVVGDLERRESMEFLKPRSKALDFTSRLPVIFQRPAGWLGKRLLKPAPIIRNRDCVGCGRCAESCPAKAIAIKNKKAVIERGKCIVCYCCHEMCPVKAIDIRRQRLFDI